MSTDTVADPASDEKLDIQTKMSETGACERHFVVTVPRSEIDKQFKTAFDEIAPQAELPGFRVGKAPRKLLENRFRVQVADRVKSTLVMQSLQQITDSGSISAISEPDMDYGAVELPDQGDFTFEFTIEVRPEFQTPEWKGISLTKPTCELSDQIINQQMVRTLKRFNDGEAVEGAAELGDTLYLTAIFRHNGQEIGTMDEEKVELRERLSLSDCEVANFGELMVGAKEGDTRNATVTISDSSSNEALRGQTVEVEFKIDSIYRLDANDIPKSVLDIFGFTHADEIRGFVRGELERQQAFQQQQTMRRQITDELLKDSKWEMPNTLVDRQTNRELQRRVLEMRRNGSSEDDIKITTNALRRNAREETIRALREHFMLEKIAEDLKMEPSSDDYEAEIAAIAAQSDVSVRRMRTNLERTGQMDAIRNQIIERQVIDSIINEAKVTEQQDTSFLKSIPAETAIDVFVAPVETSMPVAKYDERPKDSEKDTGTVKLDR